jgi:hypothetical protein
MGGGLGWRGRRCTSVSREAGAPDRRVDTSNSDSELDTTDLIPSFPLP